MTDATQPSMTVDAEAQTPGMRAQVVRFELSGPADAILRDESCYRLDLAITPRPENARACYSSHWSPHRFERLGKLFLLPPGETLHVRSDRRGAQTSVVCQLRPELLEKWLERDIEWSDRCLEASLNIQNDSLRSLLVRLAREVRHPGMASEAMTGLIEAQLAIELSRYFVAVDEIPVGGGLAPWRLRLIDEKLRDLRATPSLAELAALCRLSVRQLTRGFRASRGCSVGEYLANHRIGQAKLLLIEGQSVKAVAYTLGFASPSGFCFAFRRATGVTPREFLKRSAHPH